MDFRDIKEFLKDTSKYILLIVVTILVFIYLIAFMQVVGPSMNKTLNEGDLVFISKIHYKFTNIKRNDVIVFENNGIKNLIKRVIGIPGDKVIYKDNVLYINDIEVDDVYAYGITNDFTSADLGSEIIPHDYYLVLGDNRENSQDSRKFGLIKKDDIIGKVFFRFWPIESFKKI